MKKSDKADEPVAYRVGTGIWRDWIPSLPRPVFAHGSKKLYSVLVEGSGFCLPIDGMDTPAIGFFVVRVVAAVDAGQAEDAAFQSTLSQWRRRGLLTVTGASPKLRTEQIRLLGDRFRLRSESGFGFFQAEGG